MIHSDLATPASKTSTAYGLQNYLMNDPAYMRLYRIAGGNEQLIRALADRISARVRLRAQVRRIACAENGPLRLELDGPQGPQSEAFDAVVLALPLEALKRLTFHGGNLSEAIGRHIHHHDHPAHYLRVTLLTDQSPEPCLGDDGYLMLDAFGGCCLYSETAIEPGSGHGVLGWLIGGEAAERMSLLSDQALVAEVLDTLPPSLAHLGGRMVESRVHRWVGAVSAVPGGWDSLPEDRRHRPAAITHPGLLIVGDYLYDSTLNGALESAEYAAGWLAAHLGSLSAENA
ncbi:MAG: FAD-dependent oxidoreductase, partial [Gemmataceae bacterium]